MDYDGVDRKDRAVNEAHRQCCQNLREDADRAVAVGRWVHVGMAAWL